MNDVLQHWSAAYPARCLDNDDVHLRTTFIESSVVMVVSRSLEQSQTCYGAQYIILVSVEMFDMRCRYSDVISVDSAVHHSAVRHSAVLSCLNSILKVNHRIRQC